MAPGKSCVITLVEGNLSIQGSVVLRGCTVSYAGSGTVKPTDGGITLENRPRDTPPRVKYTGQGLSPLETTVTTVCPDGTTTVKGPLAFQWLSVPITPEYFTDPALSAFVGTYTFTHAEGSNTFDWTLTKQPP